MSGPYAARGSDWFRDLTDHSFPIVAPKRRRGATFDINEDAWSKVYPAQDSEGGIAASGGFKEFNVAHRANFTFLNNGAGLATVTWHDDFDLPHTATIPTTAPLVINNQVLHDLAITGASINIAGVLSWPEVYPPTAVSISSIPVVTITPQGGTLAVNDAAGVTSIVTALGGQNAIKFTNGSTPSAAGTVTVCIQGTGSVPTVNIGGAGALDIDSTTLAVGNLKVYSIAVDGTASIVFAGGTVVTATLKPLGTS